MVQRNSAQRRKAKRDSSLHRSLLILQRDTHLPRRFWRVYVTAGQLSPVYRIETNTLASLTRGQVGRRNCRRGLAELRKQLLSRHRWAITFRAGESAVDHAFKHGNQRIAGGRTL